MALWARIITASNSYAAGGAPLYWQFGTETDTEGGDWDDPTTWASGKVPGSEDDVTISADVTLDTSPTVNDLTIDADKTLACGNQTMTVNGDFSATEGIVTFTGAGTLNLAGTVECNAFGTFNKGQSTVNYSTEANQSVDDLDYYSLTLSGLGTKTLCGPIDVDGDLTNGATLDVSNDNNYMITIAGNWSNDGVFHAQQGTVTFDGSGDSTLKSGGVEDAFYNLTLNKVDGLNINKLSPQTSDLKVNNALNITKGAFNLANGDDSTADVNLYLGGALTIVADGLWEKSNDTTPKTVTFTGENCTLSDISTGGPQNLGHVKVGLPASD